VSANFQPAGDVSGTNLDEHGSARPASPGDKTKPKQIPAGGTSAPNAPPSTIIRNFDGVTQTTAGGAIPPDTHGAVGVSHFVEVTNRHYDVYRKSDSVNVQSLTLASKLGDSTSSLFDPRVVYDNYWNRFVTIATRKAASSTDTNRYMRLSVSPGSDPTAATLNYRIDFSGGLFTNGTWIDYPMLGYDQDAILLSGNVYQLNPSGTSTYKGSFIIAFPKAAYYNGRGSFSPSFATAFRTAPPIVEGRFSGNNTYFAAVDDTNNRVIVYRMQNSSNTSDTTVITQYNISVPAFVAPPLADQPGPNNLDPVSVAFENNIHQMNCSLWMIHTTGGTNGSFDIPHYYQINWCSGTLTRNGSVITSSSSDDWNASIAVGGTGNEVFVTYSSTSPTVNPQMRTTGCQVSAGDCDSNLGPGTLIFQSPSSLSQLDTQGRYRWGDYSAVTVDPVSYGGSCVAERRAWAVNERTINTSTWGSRIAQIGFC